MKVITNSKLIKRNKKIGQITTLVALGILGIGLYISFAKPENIALTFGALLVGFILTQIGVYYGNRWGRSPRPDEVITNSLKGLEEKNSLYNYKAGASHLLVGPAGIWLLLPITVPGDIYYEEDRERFRQKGGNFYLKLFGQESLGKPEAEVRYATEDFKKFIRKNYPDTVLPEPQAILVFTNKKATLHVEGSPIPAVTSEKLKDFIRKQPKDRWLPGMTALQEFQNVLPQEDGID